jgi:hypothetical protein
MFTAQKNTNSGFVPTERGFILVVTMLILVVLTVLCIGSLDNSNFEVQIAANDRQNRVAFNLADGGSYLFGNLVNESKVSDSTNDNVAFVDIAAPENTSMIASPNGTDFFSKRINGLKPLRNTGIEGPYDFNISSDAGEVFGHVTAQSVTYSAGGGLEFAAGAGGTGASAATYRDIDVDIDSYTARNARSKVAVRYLFKN